MGARVGMEGEELAAAIVRWGIGIARFRSAASAGLIHVSIPFCSGKYVAPTVRRTLEDLQSEHAEGDRQSCHAGDARAALPGAHDRPGLPAGFRPAPVS